MDRSKKSSEPATELDFHASGFIVQVQGSWTDSALAQFRHFLYLRRLSPSEDEILAVLQQAKANYFAGENHLFICGAQPCCATIGFDFSDSALNTLSQEVGIPISKTGCQGPCKRAPVLALRIGERQETFAEVATENAWQAVLRFFKAARQAGTLLVDPGDAEKFRVDPVHDHGKPSVHMKPLEFLLGHFRGEGKYAMIDYAFQKEVIGSFEAGGRFIALHMDASYPLADGRKDVHKAFVIVGSAPSGAITAHAYTDGGLVREYAIERVDLSLEFADLPPGHASPWKRARKVLKPTAEGFEERLDVDAGQGWTPYYVIPMRRVEG